MLAVVALAEIVFAKIVRCPSCIILKIILKRSA